MYTQNVFESNKFDIAITSNSYHKSNGLNEHYLTLKIKGKDFNVKMLNSLRRICSSYIPTYAFPPELIKITENTSEAFNNDMMRMDLSLLPVFGVDPMLDELEEKYWYNVNYADIMRPKHPNEKNIEFNLNIHNNSQDYRRVTTNDARVTVDGADFKMFDEKYPILLIELTGNQTFKCHMKAVLGIGANNRGGALWKSCPNAYYEYDETEQDVTKLEYTFTVYGTNMFSEQELLFRSCKFMIEKMKKLKKSLIDKLNEKEIELQEFMEFTFANEDYTTIEPINYELQENKDIIFSGTAKFDHLVKSMVLKVQSKSGIKSPFNALIESITTVENKFNKLGYLLYKILNKDGNDNDSNDKDSNDNDSDDNDDDKDEKSKRKINKKNKK